MIRKLLALVSVIVVLPIALTPAFADDDGDDADGLWCYAPDVTKIFPIEAPHPTPPSGKAYLSAVYESVWTGTFTGESADTGLILAHGPDPILFIGTSSFRNVEVDGVSGGLELNAIGDRPTPTSDWRGAWSVTSGTGDLTGFQAHGAFWGPGWSPSVVTEECPAGFGLIYYSVESMKGDFDDDDDDDDDNNNNNDDDDSDDD